MHSRRLYLDTADLIRIGDGTVPVEVVDALFDACANLNVMLVVSGWHLADLRAAPPDAAERVVAAMDRFPFRSVIGLDDTGATVTAVNSLRQVVDDSGPLLRTVNGAVEFASSLEREVEGQIRATTATLPERIQNLMSKLLLEMLAIESVPDMERHARAFLHKHRRDIPAERADAIVAGILDQPVIRMRQQLRSAGVWDEALATAVLRPPAAPPADAHVGKHLGLLVDQRRRKQRQRAIQNGDIPDRHHVEYAAYVDIFTGDRDICAWLNEWRRSISYERAVRAINSGHLADVVTAVRDGGHSEP